MASSQITGTISVGITLTSAAYTNPVTVTAHSYISNGHTAILATSAWTVVNYGKVVSVNGFGIDLSAGGSVTNAAGAGIISYGGVSVETVGGTVVNAGLIQSEGDPGISLTDGGSVTNVVGGRVYCTEYAGVYANYAPATVVNQGVLGGFRFGVVFRDGGSVTNAAGASIYSVEDKAVYLTGRTLGAVLNSGKIRGSEFGVYLFNQGGSVTNMAGGSITGAAKVGIESLGVATVRNGGVITGAIDAVYFDGAGANRLIVDPGAVFNGAAKAVGGGPNVIELTSSSSAGTLSGVGSKYIGFQTVTIDSGAAWTIAAAKAGFAGVTIGGFNGTDALDITDVPFAAGDTATVSASDVLTVRNIGGNTLATVQLSGSFSGIRFSVAGDGASGVKITDNGPPFSMIGGAYGGGIALTAARYADPVTLTSTAKVSNGGNGIAAATNWTIDNYGSVSSTNAAGITLSAGGSVTNASGGSIGGASYGVVLVGPGSVRNTGTIAGFGDAVYFKGAGANRLIVDAGAVFAGNVKANGAGSNTIELASSANAGGLNGLGGKYSGFQTVSIDTGATWNVAGTKAGFTGVTIQGFNADDALDITDVTFAAGDKATIGASELLTVSNAGGMTLATVQLSGSFAGVPFAVSSDGAGGIDIAEGGGTTSQIAATYAAGINLIASVQTNPVTVTSAGSVSNSIVANTDWTIVNYGHVSGATKAGISLAAGVVTNAASGRVTAASFAAVSFNKANGAVDNAGTLGGSNGVIFQFGGSVTNISGGVINGAVKNGLDFKGGPGTVTNASGGSISGAAYGIHFAAAGTALNAGKIVGAIDAIYFAGSGANRLIIDQGAVFTGAVKANAGGTNTIELASSASAGTVSGLGSKYLGFQTLQVDAGASWTAFGTLVSATLVYGTETSGVIASGDVETVFSGGTAIANAIHSGGIEIVSSGGTANEAQVSTGGVLLSIYGQISDTIVFAGGTAEEFVGSSSDTTLSGGHLLVFNGAVASGVDVESGGFALAGEFAGGTVGGTILDAVVSSGGLAVLGTDAVVSGAVIQSGGTLFELAGQATDVTVAGLQLVGGGSIPGVRPPNPAPPAVALGTTVLSGGQQTVNFHGSAIASIIQSGGEVQVNSGGLAVDAMVSSGGVLLSVLGQLSDTTIFAGGVVDQFLGSGANVTLSGGKLLVFNGAVDSAVDVGSGAFVLAGEFAAGTAGAVGGKILAAIVSSGGLAVMGTDAVFSGAVIQSGGILFELAGQATDVTLAGLQYVGGGLPGVKPPNPAPPAVATGTTISSGGMQIVNSNGSAIDTNVLSGGEIVFGGGVVSGLSLSSGGMIDLPSFVFSNGETLSFVENGAGTQGTLTVTSGGRGLAITLLGQYAAAGFSLSQDSGVGTLITYSPIGPAVLGLAANPH